MSRFIDEAIGGWMRKAESTGELEKNQYKGKKLDLDDYFNTPQELRSGYKILKDAGYVPPAVEMMKQVNEKRAELEQADNASDRDTLRRELMDLELRKNMMLSR